VTFLREHRWRVAAVVVALAVVVAGKQFYRDASAADLRVFLAPTAKLASLVTGGHFVYEAGPGWIDYDIGFIIAPPCAGVHFALAAWLALVLGGLRGMTSARATAVRLAVVAVIAYCATLVVNTVRIVIAIAMHQSTIGSASADRANMHQIEGTLVYLGGLCALYAIARALDKRRQHAVAG
jgi:exosortase K